MWKKNILFIVIVITILLIALIFLLQDTLLKAFVYPLKYEEVIWENAYEYDVDPFLIYAVIKAESSFRENAQSHKGAKGLMQITEKTGIWSSEKLKIDNFEIEHLYNPVVNIKIGCWYLGVLKKQFDGDITLMLAAYNAGSGNVTKWLKDKSLSESGYSLDRIPFPETRNYVKKVIEDYHVYKSLYER